MSEKPRRGLVYGMNLAVMIVTVLFILGIVNWLGTKHYKRWNLTEKTSDVLSSQTIQVLKSLDKDISVTYFYTQRYSDESEEARKTYKNLLERYKSLSPRFSYEMLDYAKNPLRVDEFVKGSKNLNIEDGASVVKSGEYVQKINDTSESALTQAIIKVTTGKERTVCFTEGHGEHDPDLSDTGGYSVARKALVAENYAVKKINILKDGIPETCNVLLVAGPVVPFQDEERARLKKWIDAGGKAMFLVDPTGPTGLEALFKEYGITAENDVLKTKDAASMGIDPFEIYSEDYDPSHPITESLSKKLFIIGESVGKIPMRMIEARSLKVDENPASGLEVVALISTWDIVLAYPASEAPSARAMKRIPGAQAPAGDGSHRPLTEVKSFVVAAVAKKALKEEPASTSEAGLPEEKKQGPTARIAVFGDSDWAVDGVIDQMPNGDLFMNSIAWLAEEEHTIGIRAKEKKFVPIHFAGGKNWLILAGVLLVVPLVLIINAIMVYREKKRM